MQRVIGAVFAAALFVCPIAVQAQSIAGVVRDASGAVLPGVTVEAASPVLLEKVRTALSDGTGQYRITDLTPGTYTVTYTLPGFVTVKRDAVELSGNVVVTLNTELRVGGVQETVTVTGETPVVDVQTSTRRTTVLDDSVVSAIPASRGYGNLLATVVGISGTGLDVSSGVSTNFFTARGGRGNEGTIQIDGMNVGSAFNGGGVAGFGYPTAGVAGDPGDRVRRARRSRPRRPAVQHDSTHRRQQFLRHLLPQHRRLVVAGQQSRRRTSQLRHRHGARVDQELGYGHRGGRPDHQRPPVVLQRLPQLRPARRRARSLSNRNAGNAAAWFYEPDTNVKSRSANAKMIEAIRLTGQLTPKNKLGFYYDYQKNCGGSSFTPDGDQCRNRGDDWVALGAIGGFGSVSPESGNVWDDREKIVQASWTSPPPTSCCSKRACRRSTAAGAVRFPPASTSISIPVLESNPAAGVPVGNFTYRGWNSSPSNDQQHNVWRASALVRHRRAQPEGRLSGGLPGAAPGAERQQHGAALQLQQPCAGAR